MGDVTTLLIFYELCVAKWDRQIVMFGAGLRFPKNSDHDLFEKRYFVSWVKISVRMAGDLMKIRRDCTPNKFIACVTARQELHV
jgi:hypothetical protein